jgi:hypothetical protein
MKPIQREKRKLITVTLLVSVLVLISIPYSSVFSLSSGSPPAQIVYNEGNNSVAMSAKFLAPGHELSTFSVSISPSSSILDIGQSVTLTASENQSQTYTFSWYLNGKSVGSNSSSYTFTPSSAGSYSIYVNATAGSSTVKSNTATVTVDNAPTVSISPSSEKVNVGTTINFQSTVSGGTGTFSYLWYLNGTKTTTVTSTYSFTPTGNATYYVYVVVNDTGTTNGNKVISVQSSTTEITAVQKTYLVIFQESGLPTGTKWYVNLTNGQSHSSMSTLDTFSEPNGTFTFTVASGNKVYAASQSYGTFVVSGSNSSYLITFYPVLYQVTFDETGLPSHTTWYVNVSGQTGLFSDSSTIIAKLSNGSYSFSVSTSDKEYYPTPFSGSILVNGHSITVSVDFSLKLYPVEFTENGLPANTEWFLTTTTEMNTTGYNGSGSSFSPAISLELPNGTYNFTIASGIETYGPYPSNGSFTVYGSAISEAIAFLRLYQITFVEMGLPLPSTGAKWFLTVSDPQTFNSSTDTISFWEPNQTYSYTVSSNLKWYLPYQLTQTGSFTVSGSDDSGPEIIFNELLNVSFKESKLPAGNEWYVNVSSNGTLSGSFSSTGNNVSITEINGTYSYVVSSGNKLYRPTPYQGSFVPNQTIFPIDITFSLVVYPVTFSESGLTNGTFWSIMINNNTRISTNDTLLFRLNNGTFEYSIQSLAGFSTANYSGNVTVNGSSLTDTIVWNMVTYAVNITQSGLPAGKHWSATLQGKTFNGISISITLNSTKNFVIFDEPNGTYNYSINAPFGYTGSQVKGKISVDGHPAAASANLVPPNFTLFGIIGAVAVGILATVLAFMNRHENRSFFVREGKYAKRGKITRYKK